MQNKLELGQGEPLSQYIFAKGEPTYFDQAFQNFVSIARLINWKKANPIILKMANRIYFEERDPE